MSPRLQLGAGTVSALVARQFPRWAGLPVRPVASPGWDNLSFRLGDALLVRLPSDAGYLEQVAKEQRWLPYLASHLTLPIPAPVAQGEPDATYPYPWSVYRWIEGVTAAQAPPPDLVEFAASVGDFVAELQRVPAEGGPPPGTHCFFRGAPPQVYGDEVERAVAELGGRIDGPAVLHTWAEAIAPPFTDAPVWFHGDVSPGNLLVEGSWLAAVLDFGTSGVGDPACEYAMAWTTFSGSSRRAFRDASGAQPDAWARGRAWALWKALITLPGQPDDSEPARTVAAVLADHATDS